MNDVFEDGGRPRKTVDPGWDAETLLRQSGIFYLKDIVKPLGLNQASLIWQCNHLKSTNQNPYTVMGMKFITGRWYVWMPIFEIYLRPARGFQIKDVDLAGTIHTLLEQQGIFQLTDVAKLLPFSTVRIQTRVRQNQDARAEYGVWKDAKEGVYLVDMTPFSEWVQATWPKEFT